MSAESRVPHDDAHEKHDAHGKNVATLALLALGVVYGDIGTSPLYAFRECFAEEHGLVANAANVLGILSLIFWSLLIVISLKYITFVMRANNRGEGGIMVLMSLVVPRERRGISNVSRAMFLGIFGASLLYGDGVITPAISVLSAVEGLTVATPFFKPWIIPITLGILVGLFMVQRYGTGKVGKVFGPIVLVWFIILGVMGLVGILGEPSILSAMNPMHALSFFGRNGWHGFLVLGSVFLVVTGGETLYADMGHFGRRPIRLAWFYVALPGLLLNYFGQGALILRDPASVSNPFFLLGPSWAIYPLVALATTATIIASQAVISGAFSLTRQAVQLGFLPRVRIVHTSMTEMGQIYVPVINWILMFSVIGLVLLFKESTYIAAAYGLSVSTDMVITTFLLAIVARQRWKWSYSTIVPLIALMAIVDLSFFSANMAKLFDGAWFPLMIGAFVFTLMTTWKKGRARLAEKMVAAAFPLDAFIADIARHPEKRVDGTAVFMTSNAEGAPPGLLHNLKHNRIVHRRVVLLTVTTEDVPFVPKTERSEFSDLGEGFYRILLHYGFMEKPSVAEDLWNFDPALITFDPMDTSFYLSRETLMAKKSGVMSLWREHLFIWMSRNALSADTFFDLPPNRVVELGAHIEL